MLIDSLFSESLDEENKPGLISSRNQSFMAFSYRQITKDEQAQVFKVTVLDTLLHIIYSKSISIPLSPQLFVPINFILTNNRSFFLLGIHYTTEKKVKAPDQSYFEVFGYLYEKDKPINTAIRSDNFFLTDASIASDDRNGGIVVAGFYSEKTTYSSAGVFYYSLTEDSLKSKKAIHTPFPTSYLIKFMGDQKENKELVNFSIDRLIIRKDGGVALVAESRYKSSRSYFDYYMQAFISHIYYHYGNIMAISINPDGKILWNNVITKDQNSVDDAGLFSSYYCAVTGKGLASIYNKFADENSSVLITYVDANGNQTTQVLFNELEKINIAAQSAKQLNDETVLMPAYKQNKFYMISISF
jgi:hypothetical protein